MRYSHTLTRLILLCALLAGGKLQAANPAGCEFLIQSGATSLRVLTLSESAYACMVKSDYRDIRILNGDGNSVPLHIRHPSSRSEEIDYRKPLAYSFDSVDTHLRYHQHLRRMVRSKSYHKRESAYQSWLRQHVFPASIIVENSDTEGRLERLHIDLAIPDGTSVNATVYLEYSDDLIHWTASSLPQVLHYPAAADVRQARSQLDLGAYRQSRYLRIIALSNIDDFTASITKFEGMYQRTRIVEPDYIWAEASSIQQLQNGQDWQFSMPNQLPVSRLRFQPANGIVYYSGKLMSKPITREVPEDNAYIGLREGGKQKLKHAVERIVTGKRRSFESMNTGWRHVTRFQQYHLESADDDEIRVAEPVIFSHQASRHWRITFDHPSTPMIESRFPVVEFGWTAARVRFLAQGPEPFTLRVGKSDEVARARAVPILRSNVERFETVALLAGAATDLNAQTDARDNHPQAEDGWSFANHQGIIWIVLIIGVLAMAYMAWQLLRSIDDKSSSDSEPGA